MVDSSIEQLNAHRQECLCYGSFSANRKERVTAKKLKPVHPGEILREEFMAPLELSMNKMAMTLRVPVTRIADIVNERRGITADTALRFARYFKNSPAFWMNLQTRYDLEVAEDEIAAKVARDVQPLESVAAREK
jgi:addiction module HigA family antidote